MTNAKICVNSVSILHITKDFKRNRPSVYILTVKNIENTIPHPAPEEICCCHQPIQLGTAGGKKKQRMGTDRQTDR